MSESVNSISMSRTMKVKIAPMNLDIETQIRAVFGEKKSFIFIYIFCIPYN